ncbi:phospholipid scramblase 1 isoform X2 [Callorhinchus milii]|uniref:phospholipid scramblase 1 isoform X2 n=1 Tax=Callorhinchus milii TaxID=7868 RepID=UPI001C3F5C10|nr:phospholipid scramblase 1 isoform X2 [Callorhinchus milii]
MSFCPRFTRALSTTSTIWDSSSRLYRSSTRLRCLHATYSSYVRSARRWTNTSPSAGDANASLESKLSSWTGISYNTLVGFETQNKYEVKNSLGQRIYFAVEESDFCNRMCCGANRAFTIKILDNVGQPIIQFTRPLACGFCCCPCCLNTMEVEAPPGNIIGYVTQEWHPFQPRFNVQDEKHETVLKIKGPCLAFNCFGDVGFEVVSLDESNIVGRITKQWSGLSREMFTDSDSFGIQFPMDLDVKVKAVLLGACLLVDFMYFEQNSGANQGGWQLG